jgi:hypothetical protein
LSWVGGCFPLAFVSRDRWWRPHVSLRNDSPNVFVMFFPAMGPTSSRRGGYAYGGAADFVGNCFLCALPLGVGRVLCAEVEVPVHQWPFVGRRSFSVVEPLPLPRSPFRPPTHGHGPRRAPWKKRLTAPILHYCYPGRNRTFPAAGRLAQCLKYPDNKKRGSLQRKPRIPPRIDMHWRRYRAAPSLSLLSVPPCRCSSSRLTAAKQQQPIQQGPPWRRGSARVCVCVCAHRRRRRVPRKQTSTAVAQGHTTPTCAWAHPRASHGSVRMLLPWVGDVPRLRVHARVRSPKFCFVWVVVAAFAGLPFSVSSQTKNEREKTVLSFGRGTETSVDSWPCLLPRQLGFVYAGSCANAA